MKNRLISNARRLRRNLTEAEKRIWKILRMKSLGTKFRRQGIIGQYIVDFVSFEKKLVIEIDGGQHSQNEKDAIRDEWLRSQGFKILRFWNNDVFWNLEGIFEKITECLNTPSRSLPTKKGEGI